MGVLKVFSSRENMRGHVAEQKQERMLTFFYNVPFKEADLAAYSVVAAQIDTLSFEACLPNTSELAQQLRLNEKVICELSFGTSTRQLYSAQIVLKKRRSKQKCDQILGLKIEIIVMDPTPNGALSHKASFSYLT